jgi:hypothetical protein
MDDHREAIQADKPIPPWARPGCFRLDCESHRGTLLWWLAAAGFGLGVLALFPCWGWVPGLIGIPLSLCIRYLARADLAKMEAGLMDPAGEAVTSSAENLSTLGLAFSWVGTVVWGGLLLLARWISCLLSL